MCTHEHLVLCHVHARAVATCAQVRNNLFEPVVAAFVANGPRYNLLNSAVLELLEFIRRENMKPLIAHLCETHAAKLAQADYVDTFRQLQLKYEQNKARPSPSHWPVFVGSTHLCVAFLACNKKGKFAEEAILLSRRGWERASQQGM